MNIGSLVIDERLAKFGIVGLSGMALDFAITWLCKEKAGLNKFLANSLGFTVALINNYIWNRYWTFAAAAAQPWSEQFLKFVLVSLSGLVINNLLLLLLLKKTRMHFYLLKLLVIGLVFCWNYLANFLITFH